MKRKRVFYFEKKKHNIEIDYDHMIPTEIVPGYTLDLPDMSWTVVNDAKIVKVLLTLLAVLNKDKNEVKLCGLTLNSGDNGCKVVIKSTKDKYIDFCDMFLSLLQDDIEGLEIKVD